MPSSKRWFGALAGTLVVLAACSSSGATSSAGSSSPATAPASAPAPASTDPAVATKASAPASSTTTSAAPVPTSAPVTTSAVTTAAVADAQRYAQPGPFAVGVTTLQLADRPITVWYPAVAGSESGATKATYDVREYLPIAEQAKVAGITAGVVTMDAYAGLPAAPGPFPVALFSHGFGGYRHQSTFLTTAMASWGFVVAAPEHLSRDLSAVLEGRLTGGQADVDDLKQTLLVLAAENVRADSPLAGHVDMTKVGAVGHSAGGGAVFQLAGDPSTNVSTVVGLAPALAGDQPVDTLGKPSLTISGTADAIIPADRLSAAWQHVTGPKRWATLEGVTHLGFMDNCAQGNLLALAQQATVFVPDLLVRLYADGCDPTHVPAQQAWPAIRHATIAELRSGLGIDPQPVGLDAALAAAYAPLSVVYQEG
jgi:predicted dienelactone hydrolase